MLTANEVLERYYLDVRCMLIEIGATLDRHDRAGGFPRSDDERLANIYRSLALLADREASADRAEKLLEIFSGPAD